NPDHRRQTDTCPTRGAAIVKNLGDRSSRAIRWQCRRSRRPRLYPAGGDIEVVDNLVLRDTDIGLLATGGLSAGRAQYRWNERWGQSNRMDGSGGIDLRHPGAVADIHPTRCRLLRS